MKVKVNTEDTCYSQHAPVHAVLTADAEPGPWRGRLGVPQEGRLLASRQHPQVLRGSQSGKWLQREVPAVRASIGPGTEMQPPYTMGFGVFFSVLQLSTEQVSVRQGG